MKTMTAKHVWMTTFAALLAVTAPATAADRPQRLAEYDARRLESIRRIAGDETLKKREDGGNIALATAMLYLEQDIEEANRIIVEADMVKLYWSHKNGLIPLFLMFNADNGSRKKLLTREATDKILDYLWLCFTSPKPAGQYFRRPYHVQPDQPWNYQGNQNHGFIYQTLYYFAADILKDYPKYNDQFDATKHIALGRGVDSLKGRPELAKMTLAQYVEWHEELWRNRLLWMSRQGFWSEEMLYGSMSVGPTYWLVYYSKDPVVRQRAKMVLDVHWIMVGLQMVDGIRGGAQNRYKAHHNAYHPERNTAWHYFGGRGGPRGTPALWGDYLPPELAYDIWANPDQRGSFVYRERLTQFSPKADQPPHVYKYSYVTPEYIVGSLIGHVSDGRGGYVKRDRDKIMGHYHERTMVGITLGKSRSIVRLCPIVPFRGYHAMQNGPILLARYYGHELGGRNAKADPWVEVFSRKDGGVPVDPPVEEGGWVFVEAADAYFALRPAEGKITIKDGTRFDWPGKATPIVIHAGGESVDGSFDQFKQKVLDNTLTYNNGVLTYTDPKWGKMQFNADPAKPNHQWRILNGKPVPLPDKLFDSPYLTSDYNTGIITAQFNGRKMVFDFNKNVVTQTDE
jgi:hypothetical protein